MAEQDERHRAHCTNECIMTLSHLVPKLAATCNSNTTRTRLALHSHASVNLWVDGAVAASFGTKWENGFIRTRLSIAS